MNVILDLPRVGRPLNSGYSIADVALSTQSTRFGRNKSNVKERIDL